MVPQKEIDRIQNSIAGQLFVLAGDDDQLGRGDFTLVDVQMCPDDPSSFFVFAGVGPDDGRKYLSFKVSVQLDGTVA
jgi:hypothetical protein